MWHRRDNKQRLLNKNLAQTPGRGSEGIADRSTKSRSMNGMESRMRVKGEVDGENRRERESLNSTNNKQMKLTLCEQDKDSKQNISKVRVSEKVKIKGGGRRYQRK